MFSTAFPDFLTYPSQLPLLAIREGSPVPMGWSDWRLSKNSQEKRFLGEVPTTGSPFLRLWIGGRDLDLKRVRFPVENAVLATWKTLTFNLTGEMVSELIENDPIERQAGPEEGSTSGFSLEMLSDILRVRRGTLRRWYLRGLLVPRAVVNRLPIFDFSQVVVARNLTRLITAGRSAQLIEKQLVRLAKSSAGWQASLADLDVVVDGQNVLVRQPNERLVDAFGQFRLDFYDEGTPPLADRVLEFAPPTPLSLTDAISTRSLDDLLQAALEYEDNQDPKGAIDVYRRMMLTFGPSADSAFALAEVFYSNGDLVAARERYYLAVELDEGFVEAWANLGCLLVELNDMPAAREAFEKALSIHPSYPDVHFHLAKLLDRIGSVAEAGHHWEKFLDLAASSPWADEARQRLGFDS